ncbi:hypothetical protein FKM82_024240 [Ascaphus truei]
MKSIEIVVDELYPDRPYLHNREHYEKLKYKLNANGLNVDSGYEDTNIANNCNDVMSPRLAANNDRKAHTKGRTEDTKRSKKHESEKCRIEQEIPFAAITKTETYRSKQKHLPCKISSTSLAYIVRCEHCREHKHNINSEIEIFEDPGLIECQKPNSEKTGKTRSCRKSPMRTSQEEESRLKCKACISKWKDFDRDCSEEMDNRADNRLEKCGNPDWQNSRVQNKGQRIYKKELLQSQCSTVRKNHVGELAGYSKMKPTGRLIEDFLEDSENNKPLEEDKIMLGNGGSKKEVIKEVDSTTLKTVSGSPAEREEKVHGISSVNRPRCVKDRTDVESYYEIGKTIGDGNFAVVKECRLRNANQEYAMKIIDKFKLKGKEDIVENEVRIIKSISHPNIVKLLDDYETDTEIYLILEYIKGGDLFDAITESIKFTEHDAALMLTDLCEALVYIHSKNIVHRDLKPENLLVQHNPDRTTTLKLADFGLAVHVTEPIFTVCGTPTYVAPEILSEKGYGLEVDMWATGVILYILLCGFPPFRSLERDQEELFQIIQRGQYEFLSPYWNNISDEAKDLISKLLVLDPMKRHSAMCVLQHHWISSSGQTNNRNLQREVTMNIERHFRNRRRQEMTPSEK